MPIKSSKTLISKRHWKQRKELDVLRLVNDEQTHSLQRKNEQPKHDGYWMLPRIQVRV